MSPRIITLLMGMILGIQGTEHDAQTIINQADLASKFGAIDAKKLIQSLKGSVGKACTDARSDQSSGKCGMNLKSQDIGKSSSQLYIFVSSKMPQESIKVLGQQAQKIGAHVVFRGFVGGTFPKTQNYMKDLGIAAEIDPPKFDDYKITVVPTFALINKKTVDRVSGHISLIEALDQFRKKGELKTEAHKLYQTLEGKRGES